MRNNQPVTQREYEFPANATLLSTTDTDSHISYANAAFIRKNRRRWHGRPGASSDGCGQGVFGVCRVASLR